MNFFNYGEEITHEQNKFKEKLDDLNMEKTEQLDLLSSFLFANKDIFHRAYMFDFNSISDVSQLNGEFNYWIRSLRDARRNAERTSNLTNVLNNFYVKLADIYNRINETNKEIAQFENEHKVDFNDEQLREPVEYINTITEIGNRIGEKRNKIAVIVNYINNIDTEDFMRTDHRIAIENLQNEIDFDMAEICKLLASKNLDVDNYRIFRSNISRNVANMNGTSLSLTNASYDVLYHEYGALSDMLRGFKKPMDTPKPEESHEEPSPNPSEEPPVDDNDLDNNVPEGHDDSNPDDSSEHSIDEDNSLDNSSLDSDSEDNNLDDDNDLDDEEEREPVDNSPLTQFKDKFKHAVKGISTAGSKLKANIDTKVLRKSALRWAGVVGVLAVAAVINPALLLGGAAVGAGLYEYNVAKKMK